MMQFPPYHFLRLEKCLNQKTETKSCAHAGVDQSQSVQICFPSESSPRPPLSGDNGPQNKEPLKVLLFLVLPSRQVNVSSEAIQYRCKQQGFWSAPAGLWSPARPLAGCDLWQGLCLIFPVEMRVAGALLTGLPMRMTQILVPRVQGTLYKLSFLYNLNFTQWLCYPILYITCTYSHR